jgi:hypothetical protein
MHWINSKNLILSLSKDGRRGRRFLCGSSFDGLRMRTVT